MSPLRGTTVAGLVRRSAALFSLGFVLLLAQSGGHAQTGDALKFFKNYFVTGDYVVGGVGLRGSGVNGIATGTITIDGVPANADIVAAFLYWQVVSKNNLGPNSGAVGATFKGNPLSSAAGPLAKVLSPAGTAPCWSSGGATGSSGGQHPRDEDEDDEDKGGRHRTYTYRADVLRFLDIDSNGRFIVNGPHAVQLRDSGSKGNAVPIALGASLVVIYRDSTMPLKAIVLYDGGYTMDQRTEMMSQTIKGFYQSTPGAAKITHIVGSAQAKKSERLLIPGLPPVKNPFTGGSGASWDSPTFPVSLPAGTASTRTSVDHVGFPSFDCLSWGAIVFSTSVQDTDGDGLLDIWETRGGLTDPDGQRLPNLASMGADPNVKDVFVEIGYMHAGAGTTYGGVPKPAHTHLPTAQALKMVGDAFKKQSINVHFDLGNSYPTGDADAYIIRDTTDGRDDDDDRPAHRLARGGEAIDEMKTVCTRGATDPPWVCQYSAYPGTVGWKTGLKFLRDEVVGTTDGSSIPLPPGPADDDPCDAPGSKCERRFDRNRKDTFRYALFAHALGLPKATCLLDDGSFDFDCQQNDPNFHVPRTNSGVGDFPGGDLMVTLGGFPDAAGKPVGTPFMQASTLMHELGHTFELTHAGAPPLPPLLREPNCKPNYLSVMNYLFQLRGLFNDSEPGVPHLDYSREGLAAIDETGLTDGPLSGAPYHTGWYAPRGIGSPAKAYCSGAPIAAGTPSMYRVDSTQVGGSIDWDVDGAVDQTAFSQDINFDGVPTSLNSGSNDWASLRLNQGGGRRNVGGFFFDADGQISLGPLSLDVGRGDIGRGDIGRGDIGRGDIGRGDIGRGDIGRGDIGRGDIGRGDIGIAADEIDTEISTASGNTPPNELKACVVGIGGCAAAPSQLHRNRLDWKAPNVGTVVGYTVRRFRMDEPEPKTLVGQVPSGGVVDYSLVDDENLPNAINFTYFVTATFDDGTESGPSNFTTIQAVNSPPVANADAFPTNEDIALMGNVLANDTDVDTPDHARLRAVLVLLGGPSHGALVLNADGTFVYSPSANYNGADSFTYRANDGLWSPTTVPMSPDSNAATVSITVVPVNDQPGANSQAVSTNEDIAKPITLTGSDVETPGGSLTVSYGQPGHGVVTGTWPNVTYTPAQDYNGSDSFTFAAIDRGDPDGCVGGPPTCSAPLTSVQATVSITVVPVNDAPLFTTGTDQTVFEDAVARSVPGWATAISAGPPDEAAQVLTFSVSTNNDALFAGPPAIDATTGTLTYIPAANANGVAIVTVTLHDSGGVLDGGIDTSAAQTFTIAVTEVNDPPVAAADSKTTAEDTPLVFQATDLLSNDTAGQTNEHGQQLTVVSVEATSETHGQLSLNGGSVTYQPDADYHGAASFKYTVWDDGTTDGSADPRSAVAFVTVTVTEVNDEVVAIDDRKRTPKNTTLTFPASDLTANDSAGSANESDQTLTVTAVSPTAATHGTVSLAGGSVTYVPANGFVGLASFDYTVTDNGTTNGAQDAKSAVGRVLVSVGPRAIVVSQSANAVHILDLSNYTIESTQTLGSDVTLAMDVAATPDGRQAVVTSFVDHKVVFLDLTTTPPTVVRTITTPIANEDVHVTITPAGYALIADGAPNSQVLSIDIATGNIVAALTVPFQAQAITAVPDRGVVLVSSFESPGVIHVLALAADGTLSDTGQSVSTGGNGAINATVSPDGRLALVANFSTATIGILRIDADGTVSFAGTVASNLGFSGVQSIAFSPDGAHAYVNQIVGKVAVLNIDGANDVIDSGIRIELGGMNSAYFGVDQIATHPTGAVLVHVRATTAGGDGFVAVIDPGTNSVIATIPIPNDLAGGGIAEIPW